METAYGREGDLSTSNFQRTRCVITLSQDKDGKVVGVIIGDYRPYIFMLGFECVAEHMRRKGLGALLYKASDTVIQCLARDMAGRRELPTTNEILVAAYTELDAPLWVRDFVETAGFVPVVPFIPDDEDYDLYNWGGYVDDNLDTWDKRLEY